MTAYANVGDLVVGQPCPRCNLLSVVYNGNYFCAECDWAMSDQDSKRNRQIIKAYLMQRYQEAKRAGDQPTMDRMTYYLKEYLDVVAT